MRPCNEFNDKILCMTCNIQVNENKVFKPNLNLLNRQAPNRFRYLLPYFGD